MRRVIITGPPGSGKSTLARKLAAQLGLPVIHLDPLYWRPGWREPELNGFRTLVAEAHAGATWISEGNFVDVTFDLRLPLADTLIVLDRYRLVCMRRVLWRALTQRSRPDLPVGCPESPDLELMRYIWRFQSDTHARIKAARQAIRPDLPVTYLRSDQAVAAYLASQNARQ